MSGKGQGKKNDEEKKEAEKGPGSVGPTQRRSVEEGSMMRFCPPRPVHMLPYFHGRKKFADVAGQLVNSGDYLLIADAEGLSLCAQAEDGTKHRQPIIKRPNDGKFVIEGEREHNAQGFPSVEELVTYYEVYGLTVKEEKSKTATETPLHLRLDNPINCRPDSKPPSERRRPFKQLKDLGHFHGQTTPEDAEKALTAKGDYLLREDHEKRGVFVLSVRGDQNDFLHLVMERDPLSGGYPLPQLHDMPSECAAMIDEWVQFHALFNVPVKGKYALVRAIAKPKPK